MSRAAKRVRLRPLYGLVLLGLVGYASRGRAHEPDLTVDTPPEDPADRKQLPAQPKRSLFYVNVTTARYNPGAIANLFDISYRGRLYLSDANATKQNFASVGVSTMLSPAFGRVGLLLELQPATLLQLYTRVWFSGYFGTMDFLASFDSADANFGDAAIAARAEQPGTENYASFGGEATVGLMLRGIQFGPLGLRDHFRAHYTFYNLREGDVVKYEPMVDLLMPNFGWSLVNDLDLLWASDFGLVVTARYRYAQSLFRDRHYLGGVRPENAPSNAIHGLGPLVAYMFKRPPGGRFDTPTLVLALQWHLVHPYRAGQEVHQGIPQVAVVFQFRGDLLASR